MATSGIRYVRTTPLSEYDASDAYASFMRATSVCGDSSASTGDPNATSGNNETTASARTMISSIRYRTMVRTMPDPVSFVVNSVDALILGPQS